MIEFLDKSLKFYRSYLILNINGGNSVMVLLSRRVDKLEFRFFWVFYGRRKIWLMEVIRYRYVLEINLKGLLWKFSGFFLFSYVLVYGYILLLNEFLGW